MARQKISRSSKVNSNNDVNTNSSNGHPAAKNKKGQSNTVNQVNRENAKDVPVYDEFPLGPGTADEGYVSAPEEKASILYPNILHQFASYTTLFTLSGITEKELRTWKFMNNPPHDIIARTGGIANPNVTDRSIDTQTVGDDDDLGGPMERTVQATQFNERYEDSIQILRQGHDIFFEDVNIISTASPNSERNLGQFTKMTFKLHEPFGITLIEKIRAATAVNGFLDYQDAPLLLTIEFRGSNELGRPYKVATVRKIPILITRVAMEVNEGGAVYDCTAVFHGDMAYDDRFKFPRTDIPVAASDARQWAEQVEATLAKEMQDEIEEKKREFADEYKFIIDPQVVLRGGKYKNKTETIHNTATIRGGGRGRGGFGSFISSKGPRTEYSNGSAKSGTALPKFFEDAIRNTFGYQKLAQNFWLGYLRGAGVAENRLTTQESVDSIVKSSDIKYVLKNNQYIDWFKIKTTVYTHTNRPLDKITKMHPKTIVYHAVPYRIHILKMIGPGLSLGDIDFGSQVHKEYNYIYTGDNIDVQGLRLDYKSAYYMRSVRGDDKTDSEKGIFSHIQDAFTEIFGAEDDPEPLLPLRSYPSTIKGASTIETASSENNKAQEFYDYLTNPEADMVRIELDILGDPAYICQDQFMPVDFTNPNNKLGGEGQSFDVSRQSFNADQFMPTIRVRYRLPNDIDEREGTSFSADTKYREENLFFSGIYQVNKIESRFEQGQFLQTLFCTRFNNQDGAGLDPVLVNSATKGLQNIKTRDNENKKSQAETQERNRKFKNIFSGSIEQYKGVTEGYKKIYGPEGTDIDKDSKNPRRGRG